MHKSEQYFAAFHPSIHEIEAADWDRLAGADNPFVSHGFLSALEDSGSVGTGTGWTPYHMALRSAQSGPKSAPLAVMPLYVKTHSYGEYVFDHAWADAFERAGGRYYPKLQASVPFTPVTGPRLLTGGAFGFHDIAAEMLRELAQKIQLSSVHVTFANENEAKAFEDAGFLRRDDQQFHWQNHDYGSFEDFLGALASRKRKQIRKERKRALEAGHRVHWITGSELKEAHWDAFFDFYMDTGARKWGRPYLNRSFFSLLSERMSDKVLLMLVEPPEGGAPIAGALNLIGATTLFGRHWGAREEVDCLHFETCYYQAIDYAIAHGLKTVEAGAQGPHKLARGYVPTKTHSLHWITDPGFRSAVENYLTREREDVDREIQWINETHTPFKRGDG